MTEAGWTVCIECGMMCEAVEYHPYAACLMFKHCRNSETVRANLQAVRQQGRVAGLEAIRQVCVDYEDCCLLGMVSHQNKAVTNASIGAIQFIRRQIDDLLVQQAQEGK